MTLPEGLRERLAQCTDEQKQDLARELAAELVTPDRSVLQVMGIEELFMAALQQGIGSAPTPQLEGVPLRPDGKPQDFGKESSSMSMPPLEMTLQTIKE